MSEDRALLDEVLQVAEALSFDIEGCQLEVCVLALDGGACRLTDLKPDPAAHARVIGGTSG